MRDLIVVGAGPVGSHLAEKFSARDMNVIVIEQSSEIGRPLACSGHVSPDLWDFVPENERERLEQNRIKGAKFHNEGKDYRFYKSDETVSYVIDRVELDKVKAEKAKEAGADYNLDEKVVDLVEKDRYVEVTTDKNTYNAKMVAGCDGASSTVRRKTNLPEPNHFYQGILCFSDEKDSSDLVDVFLDVPNFFGWRIPRSDSVEYGAAVPKGQKPVEWLDEILGKYDVEKDSVCAGAIPIGPPKTVTKDRVFLVGDAAAQTKPFTGGGLVYGMRSADIASQAVNPSDPSSLKVYEKSWRKALMNDIRIGLLIEKTYSMPSIIQNIGMQVFQGEIGVHMDRPTTLFTSSQLQSMMKKIFRKGNSSGVN